MKEFLQKLKLRFKSNKGATGADVVVALSVIVIAMGVVSMIFVSLSNGSKRVNRTAGATRIATNIMENIERLDYTQFEYRLAGYYDIIGKLTSDEMAPAIKAKYQGRTYDELNTTEKIEAAINSVLNNCATVEIKSGKEIYSGIDNRTIFGTKIPKGYDLDLSVKMSPMINDNPPEYDMQCLIELTISFKVNDNTEKVYLYTIKQRENIEECNKPVIADEPTGTGNHKTHKAFAVKYSTTLDAYVPTVETDPDWYDYTNKRWAYMYDENSEEYNNIARSKSSIPKTSDYLYVWIPRYSITGNVATFLFGKTSYPIMLLPIPTIEGGMANMNKSLMIYQPVTFLSTTYSAASGISNSAGVWQKVKDLGSDPGKSLKSSQYGF